MLARIQARIVGRQLEERFPNKEVEYHTATASADRNMAINIANSNSVGLFTKDISNKIINKKYDIAVHSWKDVPVEPSNQTEIIGTVDRGDMRDVLIVKKKSVKNKRVEKFQILSSSPRRKHNLTLHLSNLVPFHFERLTFLEVRGNIETRLRKFVTGDSDGIVMAKVAIDRILNSNDYMAIDFIKGILKEHKWIILPLSIFPTAPGQGAIGIEIRNDRDDLKKIINQINNKSVFDNVLKEKDTLSKYGGGCQQKIGVSIYSKNRRTIYSLKGKTEQGNELDIYDFIDTTLDKNYKNIPKELLYIQKNGENIFERIKVRNNKKIGSLENSFIHISRKNVLDDVQKIKSNNYLWTSGIKCWHHAVSLGYWVNGSSDSMGESDFNDLKFFIPNNISKYSLTHSKAKSKNYELVTTYELKVNDDILKNLQIENKEYFYWMSPTQFEIITTYYPEILNKNHSSGFGKTYDFLRTKLPNPEEISCFLSYDHWISYYKKESNHE